MYLKMCRQCAFRVLGVSCELAVIHVTKTTWLTLFAIVMWIIVAVHSYAYLLGSKSSVQWDLLHICVYRFAILALLCMQRVKQKRPLFLSKHYSAVHKGCITKHFGNAS